MVHPRPMTPINAFLLEHRLLIAGNPCVSPDFCLNWPALSEKIAAGSPLKEYAASGFKTAAGEWTLTEDVATGDCAWKLAAGGQAPFDGGTAGADRSTFFPATFENLLRLKNLILEHDAHSTIFPSTGGKLGQSTLGIGARFTSLHWPAVEWSMAQLGFGVTANQNSIPRELVYDVTAMLEGRLDTVSFPFIGAQVPEGHQGQSVEGMSHGCILSKLKTGFHRRRIAWSFNADHQPIGGKFDDREDQLVEGCVLASYITFDLSPELAQTAMPADPAGWIKSQVPAQLIATVQQRIGQAGVTLPEDEFSRLLASVWPAMSKMKRRDEKYRAARARRFTTPAGQAYLRELSIDELPGLTTPATTAIMLALCEALEMKLSFVAPAFGFQKNMPYPDNAALQALIERQWAVCRSFGVSIGFHSGSGKSAENYRVMGDVTGGHLEIKTSGRYTYEMGRALSASTDAGDQALWRDWYEFTRELALLGSFSADPTEQKMARSFVADALQLAGKPAERFDTPAATRATLETLTPSPDHMFWFEYNFLHVLAAGGRPAKVALGDHTAAGYRQRERFYSISAEGRLLYSRNVARYILFLAESTGLGSAAHCAAARTKLEAYASLDAMLADIAP